MVGSIYRQHMQVLLVPATNIRNPLIKTRMMNNVTSTGKDPVSPVQGGVISCVDAQHDSFVSVLIFRCPLRQL